MPPTSCSKVGLNARAGSVRSVAICVSDPPAEKHYGAAEEGYTKAISLNPEVRRPRPMHETPASAHMQLSPRRTRPSTATGRSPTSGLSSMAQRSRMHPKQLS